jgi:hypothetical protein
LATHLQQTLRPVPTVLSLLGIPFKFFYLNSLGAGFIVKMSNIHLSGSILLATAEALTMGVNMASTHSPYALRTPLDKAGCAIA